MLFWWIAGMMGSAELLFVGVDKFQIDPDPVLCIVMALFVLPLSLGAVMTLRAKRRGTLEEPDAWPRFAIAGAVMTSLWAIIYFLVSRLPDPGRVTYLSTALEDHISLRPAYSLLYVLLYPIFALPYLVVRDPAVMRRLITADVVMIAVCSVFFVAVPVGVLRPPLPVTDDLGTWVLTQVWSSDVSWNCMPSEHCMAAMIAALACWESDKRVGAFAFLATFCIGLSTLFTKQHYLVDVVVGFALAIGLHAALRWSRSVDTEPTAGSSGVLDRLFDRISSAR
ncbi:MAG TPA: phosphatase PAP2 family protein [Myxococcales bacterium]|jgi:membrane-associated phospholipid phosphatase